MKDRIDIAAEVAASLVHGLAIQPSDVLDGMTDEQLGDAKKCCRAIAQISWLIANAIMDEYEPQDLARRQAEATRRTDVPF